MTDLAAAEADLESGPSRSRPTPHPLHAISQEPFIDPVAMENDPDGLFAGDRGALDSDVRRVLVRLLQRRFLLADRQRAEWAVLLEHQQTIESRLNELFVRLVVDHDRGVAYKEQVRSDELDIPILLRDDAYNRAETLVLVHLRSVYQRESTAGESAPRVDIEDIEQTVLSYFAEADGDTAKRQRAIRSALARLKQDGVIDEESEGRYRISALVEIVLNSDRLLELKTWLTEQSAPVAQATIGTGGAAGTGGAEDVTDMTDVTDTADDSVDDSEETAQ